MKQIAIDPQISEWGNPAVVIDGHRMVNKIVIRGEPPELKHLSRARKSNQPRFRK